MQNRATISVLQTQFTLPSPVSPLAQCWPHPPPRGDTQIEQYLPTPPDTPLEPLQTQSPMFSLPNETLDRIFSFVSQTTLTIVMRANTRCHALAERLLYHKIQHIQLFSPEDGHCSKDWQCIRTLASRRSAAAAVRHFAVKGLPWLTSREIQLLASALSAMANLSSLELNLGPQAEHTLVSLKPFISSSLCALNVLDAKTAVELCTGGMRPISALRIGYDSPLDLATANELLLTVGQSSEPVELLQLAVQCDTKSQFLAFLRTVARFCPHLTTLGLHVRSICSLDDEKDWVSSSILCGFRSITDSPLWQELARDGGDILAQFPMLQQFSLAGPAYVVRGSKEDAELWVHASQRLELVELQWSAWRRQLSGVTQECKPVSSHHAFIRRRWAYEHASMD